MTITEVLDKLTNWAEDNKYDISDFDSADLLKDPERLENASEEIRIRNEAMDELIEYIKSLRGKL